VMKKERGVEFFPPRHRRQMSPSDDEVEKQRVFPPRNKADHSLTCWSAGCLFRTRVGRGRRGAAAPAAPEGAMNWSSAIVRRFSTAEEKNESPFLVPSVSPLQVRSVMR